MTNHINTVKDAATKAAESAATTVKSVASRAPKFSFPTIEIPSEVQSYVDAATKSATQTSDSIKSNVTSTVTLLREAVGR